MNDSNSPKNIPHFRIIEGIIKKVGGWETDLRLESDLVTDLGLDSLRRIEFWSELETTFEIKIPEKEFLKFKTLEEIFLYLKNFPLPSGAFELEKKGFGLRISDWHKVFEETSPILLQKMGDIPKLNRWVRRTAIRFVKPIFKIFYKLNSRGLQNLPKKGPFVLACNHTSFLDYFLIATVLSKDVEKQVVVMAATQFFKKNRFLYWLVRKFGQVFFINLEEISSASLQVAFQNLKNGRILLTFPEGIRTPNGLLLPLKPGPALFALTAQCPLIPILIDGAYEVWPRSKKFPRLRGKIRVSFGTPIMADMTSSEIESNSLLENAEALTLQVKHQMEKFKNG